MFTMLTLKFYVDVSETNRMLANIYSLHRRKANSEIKICLLKFVFLHDCKKIQ